MKENLEEGLQGRQQKVVTREDTAVAYGSGLVEVFATPAMIALMENTAHQSVQEYLPEGSLTVGYELKVRHLKATAIGDTVWAESLLERVDGSKLQFSVRAFDSSGEIGNGTHVRYIVQKEKFMNSLKG